MRKLTGLLLTAFFGFSLIVSLDVLAAKISTSGTVLETFDVVGATYVLIETADEKLWARGPITDLKDGGKVFVIGDARLTNFHSKLAGRTFEQIILATSLETSREAASNYIIKPKSSSGYDSDVYISEKGSNAYEKGDYATALKELQPLAEKGNIHAQVYVGYMYANGQGVPLNNKKAAYWFTKAAEQGDYEAQYNIGYCYSHAIGATKDYKKAIYWYTKSAKQGYAPARFKLGYMYYKGFGVPKNIKQAIYWYTKAAKQGETLAQISLASQFEKGQEVLQDYKKAAYWYSKAAMQGDAVAQLSLGIMYAKGEGVLQDFVHAYAWFNIAASQGNEKAKGARDLALKDMSPSQVSKAQELSKQLYNKIYAGN